MKTFSMEELEAYSIVERRPKRTLEELEADAIVEEFFRHLEWKTGEASAAIREGACGNDSPKELP